MLRVPKTVGRVPTVVSTFLSNLVPLLGVVALGWSLLEVMFLFWAESAVIGLFNIAKMLRIDLKKGAVLTPFFIFHFGFFMFVHAVFLIVLFAPKPATELFVTPSVAIAWAALEPALLGLAAVAVSEAVSFVVDFVRNREFERTTVDNQMAAPYKRIVVMQIAVIAGAWFINLLGQPIAALVILVTLKALIDLFAHVRAHTPPTESTGQAG